MLSKTKKRKRGQRVNGRRSSLPEWLTLAQAAELCNTLTGHPISMNTFRRHVLVKMRTRRLGWRVMVERAVLEHYCREHLPIAARKKAAVRG